MYISGDLSNIGDRMDSPEETNKFPVEIHEKLGYYVYRLINPSTGNTFYVGKGKGDRVFAHINAAASLVCEEEDVESLKLREIRNIQNSGLSVIHVIHRHGMSEGTAKEVEAALIDAYPGLTNIMGGEGSGDYGPMHVTEIIKSYMSEEITSFDSNCLLIKINRSLDEHDIYDATRYAWKLNKKRVEKVDYVMSVVKGIIRKVYIPEKWLEANETNFPGFPLVDPKRYGFRGREASQEIQKKFVDKKIPESLRQRGSANPITYIEES